MFCWNKPLSFLLLESPWMRGFVIIPSKADTLDAANAISSRTGIAVGDLVVPGGIAVAFGPERRPALAHRDRVQPFHCIVGVAGHDSVGKRSGCQPTVRVIPVAGQSRVALADGLDLTVTVMFLSGYSILVMGESVRNLCVEPS